MENQINDTYKKQTKVSFFAFLSEVPNFVMVLASVILTNSIILWTDLAGSTCNLLRTGFVAFSSIKMNKQRANIDKIAFRKREIKVGLFVDILNLITIGILTFVSINDFFSPDDISENLGWTILLKIINVIVDLLIFINQTRLLKKENTPLIRSEFTSYLLALVFDTAVLISVTLCYFFRNYEFAPYLQPIFCIGLGIYVTIRIIIELNRNFKEMKEIKKQYRFLS